MSALAKNGNKVIFMESTGVRTPSFKDFGRIKNRLFSWFKGLNTPNEPVKNIFLFSPLVLPFPYSNIARKINKYLILKKLKSMNIDFSNLIVWTYLPTWTAIDIIKTLKPKLSIYYCADNFSASSESAIKIKKTEEEILRTCDIVFVTADRLYKHALQFSSKTFKFPHGVNIDIFAEARKTEISPPNDLKHIKHPIIGYIGSIHRWLDLNLLEDIAKKMPDFSFVFVGPVQTKVSSLKNHPNIYFTGKKEHNELPYYVKFFDVCIIPYLITSYTESVAPTKLNEYLAMGKPVVSTPLPEIISFNRESGDIVDIADGAVNFSEAISRTYRNNNSDLIRKRIAIAEGNTWQKRINDMSEIIETNILENKDVLNLRLMTGRR
jgi:glycosyltransferase involved in cell wall biosynthesis